jgi:MFS family permease
MSYKKNLQTHPVWLQEYVNSPEKQRKLYKRTIMAVMLSQIFGGAGLAAGVTVGALLAQDMLGTDNLAGIPMALFTLGSAGAAMLVGWLSQQFGRRLGLGIGFLAGGIGAAGIVIAAAANNIPLFFISLLIYGSGTATNLQARYAGTDLADPKERATAASRAMVATTFGAVAGPNLAGRMGVFAEFVGVPSLAGIFILAAVAYTLAGVALFLFLRPDPLLVSNAIAQKQKAREEQAKTDAAAVLTVNKRGIVVGAALMILAQIIMVLIMTMTPVHMKHYGHGLGQVGLVIGMHIGSMYLPSLITGVIADKVGRKKTAIASGVTLILAALIAANAPPQSAASLIAALSLLGLGWNLGIISGTATIVDATVPSNRAKIQGSVDVLVSLGGATAGLVSGFIMAQSSYAVLSLSGGLIALLLIVVMAWSNSTKGKQVVSRNSAR